MRDMRDRIRLLITAAVLCIAAAIHTASAAVDSFRIRQLYSNQNGDWQFVELEEVPGSSGDVMFHQFAGLTLSVTNRYGVTKNFTFTHDLPSGLPTGPRRVIVVSELLVQPASYVPPFVPHFVMPNQFLPTDGGSIDFAGIDRWTFDALPTLGQGLIRSGDSAGMTQGLPLMQNFAGRQVYPSGGFTSVYEYYDSGADHYFMSGSQPDIDALDTGRIPGWLRTGNALYAPSAPYAADQMPVCRYFIPPGSHFFSASADECAAVGQYAGFVLETPVAFSAWLPDPVTGACPPSDYNGFTGPVELLPVYRLWNKRLDTNHRYTTSLAVREQVMAQGWISEGYGPNGVAICALQTLDY